MRRILSSIAFAICCSSVNAALIDRGNGLIYDTDLDITWLQDANYARTSGYSETGILTYSEAQYFVSTLNIAGFTDWRLPETNNEYTTVKCVGFDCFESDLGHLYYIELGKSAGSGITSLTTTPFINLQTDVYWSYRDTTYQPGGEIFDLRNGKQGGISLYTPTFYVWAVHDGDIGATLVPAPAAAWLFGTGLVSLIGFARRKAA